MELEALASAQDGVVTTAQLRGCGVSRAVERRRLNEGAWLRLHRGVLLVQPERATGNAAWVAARGAHLACPGAVLAGRTAARLYELAGITDGPEEVLVEPHRAVRARPRLLAHRGHLGQDEVTTVRGMPVTTPGRTLTDLSLGSDRLVAVALTDSALRRGAVTARDLSGLADRASGRPGSGGLVDLWNLADSRSESVLESRVRLRCVDDGLPPDALQLVVRDAHGAVVGRADLAFRRPGRRGWLLVEADGAGVHGSPDALFRDRARANALTALGHLLLRFTWRDTLDPFTIPRSVRAALRAA
ncbi:type IV toxin-antitoxin system AbiEi family antitoxin domain-containing protein [Jannaschia sp. R86511]|uniref:type IV toxin-antitoxin system AbiEi family antitoxin domain-containing protein n=1 Tax=Jannaschia sp. R86511 TaxID=3093853 RepID=UPI0036D2F3CD